MLSDQQREQYLLGVSQGGGPCGVWTQRDGQTVVELRAPAAVTARQ